MLVINNLLLIQPLLCGEILSLGEKKKKAITCKKDVFKNDPRFTYFEGKKS